MLEPRIYPRLSRKPKPGFYSVVSQFSYGAAVKIYNIKIIYI